MSILKEAIAKIEDENDGEQPSTSFHGASPSFSDAVDKDLK